MNTMRTTYVKSHERHNKFNAGKYLTQIAKKEKWAEQRKELKQQEKAEKKAMQKTKK